MNIKELSQEELQKVYNRLETRHSYLMDNLRMELFPVLELTAEEVEGNFNRFNRLTNSPKVHELQSVQAKIFSLSVYQKSINIGIYCKENIEILERNGFKVERVFSEDFKDMYKISWG